MKKYLYSDLYELEEKHWWHLAKRNVLINLIESAGFKKLKGQRILEIGCGTGKNLEILAKFGKTWGLDNSMKAMKFCRKRGLTNVVYGEAEKIPFPSNNFDLVILLDVLEHTDDIKTTKEISRVLKRKSYLILTVPAFHWLWSQWDVVLGHKRRYTQEQLRKILVSEDFAILNINHMFSFLVLPAFLVRFIKSKIFKKKYPSDFRISAPFLNQILLQFANIERKFLFKISIPFGTSIICLAQKK